jgi:hypothetical protein
MAMKGNIYVSYLLPCVRFRVLLGHGFKWNT